MRKCTSSPQSPQLHAFALAGLLLTLLTGCNTIESDPSVYQGVRIPPPMTYGANVDRTQAIDLDASIDPSQVPGIRENEAPLPPAYNVRNNRKLLTRSQVVAELRSQGINCSPNVVDNTYIVPDHNWVAQHYYPYFQWYIHYLRVEYQAEGMDCDNYSAFYKQNMVLSNLKAGGTRYGDVPCAVMVVYQYDKGITHMLNLVRTNRGWFAVEPQDGIMTPLNSYRYRNNIKYVDF